MMLSVVLFHLIKIINSNFILRKNPKWGSLQIRLYLKSPTFSRSKRRNEIIHCSLLLGIFCHRRSIGTEKVIEILFILLRYLTKLCCNIVLYRVPLQPINPGRRTIEDIRESRRNIANRWGAVGYDELPEEPITNYMDVNFIRISLKQFISTLDNL